jgi:hypothetical protein
MKRVVFVSVGICFLSLLAVSCKPSGKAAAQYNNKLVRQQIHIGALQQELIKVFNGQKAADMKVMLDKFRAELKAVNDSVAAMAEFDGRDDFKK